MQQLTCLCLGIALAATAARALTDITFFAVSDVHFGQSSASKDANRNGMPGFLNNLPGKLYPAAVGGGPVAAPKGVLVPGDLIDYANQSLWNQYVAHYGVKGEGMIKFPVYDGLGNHDYSGSGSLVVTALRNRNKTRTGLTQVDANNMHYSWDWDGVHFVQLNLYSGDVSGGHNPFNAYSFLEQDLAKNVGTSGRPVIIMQHFPIPSTSWWPQAEATRTGVLLKKYNTLGILHGHSHGRKFYKFDGLDVWDDGTVMNGDILVFRITDTKMFVVNRVGDAWGNMVFQKNITMGTGPVGVDARRDGARAMDFRFSVDGVGEIYAGNIEALGVEIADLSGRVVRQLAAGGRTRAWDRRDASGRAAAPGVYLVRIRSRMGLFHAKVTL